VDCKNRENSNLWIPRKRENLTCGFQGLGEIKHVDSMNRGNSNMWIPRTERILRFGFQEQGNSNL
jgi:hypothetical protein